jgi:tetratricopeptide (TPR) repeat protein
MALIENMYGFMLEQKGEGLLTIEHVQNCINICEENQFTTFLGLSWSYLGAGYWLLGDLDTSLKFIKKGLKIQADIGRRGLTSLIYSSQNRTLYDSEKYEEAQASAEKGLKLAIENNEKWIEAFSRIALGKVLSIEDASREAEAEKHILRGIDSLKKLGLRPSYAQGYLDLGEFYFNSGHKKKAMKTVKKAEEMFREMGMTHWQNKASLMLES